MTLLVFFFIVSSVVIFITALDIVNKRKFNVVHFLIFLFSGGALFLFSVYPNSLQKVGDLFGVARGADVLVYASIVLLFYFSLLLLKKLVESSDDMTGIVREIAIDSQDKRELKGKYAFVIPVYNEEVVLEKTINSILDAGYSNIIVINDGSRDKSGVILEKLKDKIIVLRHLKNRGQGAALETGFEYIRRYSLVEYIVTFDSDGQHRIEDLKVFEEYINKNRGVQVFLGSRFLVPTSNIPFTRKIILKLGIMFTYIVSGIKLSDAHNGYRVIRRDAIFDIRISQDGMSHASEIIDIIGSKKLKFLEVPVVIEYSDYSKAKGQKSSNAIFIALRTLWDKFFR